MGLVSGVRKLLGALYGWPFEWPERCRRWFKRPFLFNSCYYYTRHQFINLGENEVVTSFINLEI